MVQYKQNTVYIVYYENRAQSQSTMYKHEEGWAGDLRFTSINRTENIKKIFMLQKVTIYSYTHNPYANIYIFQCLAIY